MNNEINQIATDMNNMASDTQQGGTGIGQSSPNIDLNAGRQDNHNRAEEKSYSQAYNEWEKEEEYNNKTHGDIMSDTQKYEAEIDRINEIQELYRNGNFMKANELAKQLNFNMNDYNEGKKIDFDNFTWSQIADLMDPRKSELLDNVKGLKEHENFDNRTDEQKRSDKLLADQQEREDTVAQRGTQDMLKAGLHPASANYGGSIGGSSGGGGGGSGSQSDNEKERRRRRKKLLEERKREREKEKRQNVMKLLATMGSAATYGGMRNMGKSKNMNNPKTNTGTKPLTKHKESPNWLNEYMDEIKEMKPANKNMNEDYEIYNRLMKKEINKLK